MGASHSAELLDEQDSVAEPGTKSIISASLDELDPPPSEKEILDELLHLVKYPIDPTTEAVLKAVDVQEHSADEFTVKVVIDGAKLDSYGYGRGDGMDRVRNWKRVTMDRSNHKVITQDYVDETTHGAWADEASDREIFCMTAIHMLSSPTRMEFCVDRGGERVATAELRDSLYGWTDAIIGGVQQAKTAKVKVAPRQPSIKERGKLSNVSEPMDSHVDYDNFFKYLVGVVKKHLADSPGHEVTDLSECEFAAEAKTGREGQEKVLRSAVKFSKETGEIEMQTTNDGVLTRGTYYQVHQSPLVLEGWAMDPDGSRISGESTARELQRQVNDAIDKANSWFG